MFSSVNETSDGINNQSVFIADNLDNLQQQQQIDSLGLNYSYGNSSKLKRIEYGRTNGVTVELTTCMMIVAITKIRNLSTSITTAPMESERAEMRSID
uniref:Uncharacterized protein n=1 Tax=Rhizophagus irregularis (strain DAOM 181602 / DAOM 197198 / MUCL 43194) TaxID=747089 RepID=U9U0Z7_RHIID